MDRDFAAPFIDIRYLPRLSGKGADESEGGQGDHAEGHEPAEEGKPGNQGDQDIEDEDDQALLGVELGEFGVRTQEQRDEPEDKDVGQCRDLAIFLDIGSVA